MIGARTRQGWFVAISCCALLAACGEPSGPEVPKDGAATTRKPPKAPSVVDDMVAAVSASKSAAAVGVYFSLGNTPTVKTALPVKIAVLPHRQFNSLRAYFSAQDGLTVISGDQLPLITTVPVEKPIEHQLVVMPVRPGVYMITATLETDGDDGSVSRIFSIPVIATPAEPAPKPTAPPPAPESAQPEAIKPEAIRK